MNEKAAQLIAEEVKQKTGKLDLSFCELEQIPADIAAMNWLKELTLFSNSITAVTNLENIPGLQLLNLETNRINEIPNLQALPNLQHLNLGGNAIHEIKNLEAVPHLKKLDLRRNQIKEICNLEAVPGLTRLYLSYNLITEINNLESLTQLQVLRLEGNAIEIANALTALVRLQTLEELRLFGIKYNNLHIPPEYFGKSDTDNCLALLRSYFESIKSGATFTKEIPVVLVGNSTAGKTSLRFFLKEKIFPPPKDYSTHGIEPDIWQPTPDLWPAPLLHSSFTNAQIYFWDFGGQEYYHATHRLFFSREAIYVLLWDAATNKQGLETIAIRMLQKDGTVKEEKLPVQLFPYRYWLNTIRFYASWKMGAPILLVQNKIDVNGTVKEYPDAKDYSDFGIDKVFHLSLQKAWEDKDSKAFRDVEDFLEQLLTLAKRHAQRMARVTHWNAIRSRMQEFKSEHCWTREEFLAHLQMIDPYVEENSLLSYTADLSANGFIFHFNDDPFLRDYVFIDPAWVTECIYIILDQSVLESNGEFTEQHVEEKAGKQYAKAFIALMKRFELIFENKETGDFIAPQYLPTQLTDKKSSIGKWNGLQKRFHDFLQPQFYVRFSQFLPPSVMLLLLNRYGSEAVDQTYWKNGIAFMLDGKEVLILLDTAKNCFTIFVENNDKLVQRLVFDAFYQSVPNGQTLQISLNQQDYVTYSELYKYANNSEVAAENGNMVSCSYLRHFVENLETLKKKYAMTNENKAISVFISYAHEDEKEKDILLNTYLEAIKLNLDFTLSVWTDEQIQGGMNWNTAIQKELENADIVLFLISSSFAASKYSKTVEIKNAVERFKQGKQIIVPIYIETVAKELLPFREKQYLPGSKPLKDWKQRNDAWVKIQSGLIKIFKDVKEGKTEPYFS